MIHPFDNDHEALSIGGLSVENGLDGIAIYGDLTIYPNADGLNQAKALQAFADVLVTKLTDRLNRPLAGDSTNDLSVTDSDAVQTKETIDNPFA